jgi:SNF2 family DNA or RNA helicase
MSIELKASKESIKLQEKLDGGWDGLLDFFHVLIKDEEVAENLWSQVVNQGVEESSDIYFSFDGKNYIKEVSSTFRNVYKDLAPKFQAKLKTWMGGDPETITDIPEDKSKKEYTLYKNKYTSLIYTVPSLKNYYNKATDMDIKVLFFVSDKELSFVTKKFKDEDAKKKIGYKLLHCCWENDAIPNILDPGYKLSKGKVLKGYVKLSDGVLFYIPEKDSDNRKNFFKLANEKKNIPKNAYILYDAKAGVLHHTNADRELLTFDVKGAMPLSDTDIVRLLKSSLSEVVTGSYAPSSCFGLWDKFWEMSREIQNLANKYENTPMNEIPVDELFKILDHIQKDIYWPKKNDVSPIRYLKVIGILQIIVQNIKKFKTIEARYEKNRKAFKDASGDNVAAISSVKNLLALFPHQAETLAKLQHAGKTAILDVGTGGGKTILILSEILQLMGKGKIKKPLIICPQALVGQWTSQIEFFTKGSINPFPLTSESRNSWGDEELKVAVLEAPPNSIVIASYDYLKLDKDLNDGGTYTFPKTDWLKDEHGVDGVWLDESQSIRNPTSLANQACVEFKDVEYKRLATGTFIVNTPEDLVGQMAFLDPRLLGTRKDFEQKYKSHYGDWNPDAREKIRKALMEGSYYLHYSERDWAAALPTIKYDYHLISMTKNQQDIYAKILEGIIAEIMNDPILGPAWLKFQNAAEEDLDVTYAPLLAKFAKLEQYITAPDYAGFFKYYKELKDTNVKIADIDTVSSKVAKVDELIEKSIQKGRKVLVAVHFKASAKHLFENSKFKNISAYYDAGYKQIITKFTDPKKDPQVVFSVSQSISEGFNLQVADRIILCDMDWTPGKTKQLIARIWRPTDPTKIDKSATVHIDYVMANQSADIIKIARMISKKIMNAGIQEGCHIEEPVLPIIGGSGDFLLGHDFLNRGEYLAKDIEYDGWINQLVEEKRADPNYKPVAPKHSKDIKGEKVHTPWVTGMNIPEDIDSKSLESYLEDLQEKDQAEYLIKEETGNVDLSNARELLKGLKVFVEGQEAIVTGVSKRKVRVEFDDGTQRSFPSSLVLVLNDQTIEEEEEEVSDNTVWLNPIIYNGMYSLSAELEDPDSQELKKVGFVYQGPYWFFRVRNKKMGHELLKKLDKKYSIPSLNKKEIEEVIEQMYKNKIDLEHMPEVRNFFKVRHRVAKKGSLKLYPMVEDGILYFTADIKVHPGVQLGRYQFKKEDGFWYYFPKTKTKTELKKIITKIQKQLGMEIGGLDELKDGLREMGLTASPIIEEKKPILDYSPLEKIKTQSSWDDIFK